jgi:hypothetical protein
VHEFFAANVIFCRTVYLLPSPRGLHNLEWVELCGRSKHGHCILAD